MAEILDYLPDGWHIIQGALTAPVGYVWVCNNKPRWGGEYRHALVREELVDNPKEKEE